MTATFNYDPYYDDFDEDKNFMRVLFRPGYSVQARELTQLQTILANQIEKFGNHIFKSGSPIVGGKVSLDNKANYVVLAAQYNNLDVDATQFLNKTVVSYNSTKIIRAKVIAIDTSTANPILILKYLSGERFAESDEIRVYGQEIYAQLRSTAAVGGSFIAKLQEGIYYFKGQFVKVVPQYLVLEIFYRVGYNTTTINLNPSYKIGIEFTETIVDEIDDTSLLDPAQGAFNYQAPGAERFAIQTSLSKRTLDSADISTFFEIVRLVNGVKTKEIDYPIYSEIEKTLARRTHDESGNYTVDPFVISLEEGDSANGKFNVILDPGKAYVSGYEFETIAPTIIEVDRAREVSTANSDIPTNYESSLVLANVRGTLDITSFPSLDIHSVPHTSISFTTAPAYNSTKIGTIYANMIRYNDASNTEIGTTLTFTVNTFGANTVPITGTLAAAGSSATTIAIPAAFNNALPLNAYANMYFQITNGAGASLSPILITSSNTVTLNLASSLTFIPGSNTFTIQSDIKNAESLSQNGGSYIQFAGNIDTDSKDPTTGFVSISEPAKTSLVFETPYEAIKANTISNMDFQVRKKYSGTTTGTGKFTVTASGTDTFSFLPASGTVSDSLILNNIICFVRSDSASNTQYGIAPNTSISLSNNNFTITTVSTSSFEVDLKTLTDVIKVDLLVTTKINNAEVGATGVTKRKQLVPITGGTDLHSLIPYEMNTAGTQGTTVLSSASTTGEVTYFSGGAVFKSIGATNFDNGTVLTDLRTPGKAVSLQVPDVYELIGIYDSRNTGANVTSAMLTTVSNDITSHYEFDNGQRKTHYDHATITLKRGYSAPVGKVFVQYRYFKNLSVFAGLFDVDSYAQGSNISYSDISKFDNKEDKKLISLRGAFDFRPYKDVGGTSLSGALNPEPLENITMDFDYFLPRIDQVVVKSSREIGVLRGQSAVVPVPPPVDTKDMLIYTLYIPAYTESVKDIRADFRNHRRYTMSDIQAFEDRIRGLEYYVALTTLEKDAASTKILDNNGLERSKYGILVDNFTSKDSQATISDVDLDNRNLIDAGRLYPASLMRTVSLETNTSMSSGATKIVGTGTKKALMLSYTTSEFAKQPYATKSMAVADATFANFKGKTKLFPEFTGDVDTGSTARVTLNSTQGIDNAFNFINSTLKYVADNNKQWADDKDSPFAQIADSKWYKTLKETDYTKQSTVHLGGQTFGVVAAVNDNTYLTKGAELNQKQISTSTSQVDVGTFVTDLAIQPYMKSKQILFATDGMRPSTVMYSFFDNTDVNKYIVVPNKVTLSANTTLISGESVLIANTVGDLAANLASLLAGGTSYSAAFVVVSEPGSANVSIINETGKPLSSKYVYALDSGNTYTISSVTDHRSGVTRGITATTITLASDAPAYSIVGNTITIIRSTSSFEGVGAQFVVTAYDTSTKVATVSGATAYVGGTYVYSFGTNMSNKLGQVGGAFYMPKATFRSGERNFRVTESFNNTYDADSISFSDKTYNATGLTVSKTTLVDTVLNVDVERKIVGTQTSDRLLGSVAAGQQLLSTFTIDVSATGGTDPLAQTFFVDPVVYPQGLFLSSVDLFFKAKDDELPVTMQIRPTVNGFPSSDFWYPESVVTKYPSQINVSETPSVTDSSTSTNFEFSFPVYLKPGQYALIVLTDTQEYIVWEAEKGGTTTNNEYVDKQPYMGTLYKSQNTAEWTPFINEDLMFRLNRCVFTTNSTATYYLRNQALSTSTNYDKLRLLTKPIIPDAKVTSLTHSIATTTILGTKESSFRTMSPGQTYSFSSDDLYQVGYRRKKMFNANDFTLKLEMTTTSDAVSPIFSMEAASVNIWENYIDNAEINSEDFTITATGTGYGNSNVVTITSSTGTGATANLHVDADGKVLSVYVSSPGSGYLDDFTISYPDTGNSLITSNASIVLNSEYDSSGGPCLARYITKPVQLADGYDAGDLRVFLGANKPGSSEVSVFYKVLSASDATRFKDRPYEKMVCINPTVTASQDPDTFREYEYRPSATTNALTYTGTNGVTYDSFKTFAIKIVLTSSDPAIVPSVKDLRIIATPAE